VTMLTTELPDTIPETVELQGILLGLVMSGGVWAGIVWLMHRLWA